KFKILTRVVGEGLDTWLSRRADVFFLNRIGKGAADHIANHFLTHTFAKALTQHFHGHLALAEAVETDSGSSLYKPVIYFVIDLLSGHANGHATFKVGNCLNGNLHGFSSPLLFNKENRCMSQTLIWCERRDSNSHGLPHWNLNPARLPVPPLSHFRPQPEKGGDFAIGEHYRQLIDAHLLAQSGNATFFTTLSPWLLS